MVSWSHLPMFLCLQVICINSHLFIFANQIVIPAGEFAETVVKGAAVLAAGGGGRTTVKIIL